jgi:hypothetical protein
MYIHTFIYIYCHLGFRQEESENNPLLNLKNHTSFHNSNTIPVQSRGSTGMARPQVADGVDGLQMWRVAVNILGR